MINELDEALRRLLVREMPIKNGEINIAFEQPKREWSSRLNRPTLNLFLHDVRENTTLRQHEWQVGRNDDGTYTRQQKPVRVDLYYMITVWAADPEDEHRLLTRALMSLFRNPVLPEELLPDALQEHPFPIPLQVAQREAMPNAAELWGALDNELRPAIGCMVTLALNPFQPFTGPLVRTRDLRVGRSAEPQREQLDGEDGERFWMVGGALRADVTLDNTRLTLLERGQRVLLQPDGHFIVGNLAAGDYTLELTTDGREAMRHKITVPSPSYDIEL